MKNAMRLERKSLRVSGSKAQQAKQAPEAIPIHEAIPNYSEGTTGEAASFSAVVATGRTHSHR